MVLASRQAIPIQNARTGVVAKVPTPIVGPRGPIMGAPVASQPYRVSAPPLTPAAGARPVSGAPAATSPAPMSGTLHPTTPTPAPTVSALSSPPRPPGPITALPTPPAPTLTLPTPAAPTAGAPAPFNAAPPPTATGAATSNLTGNEGPYAVLPQQSASLQALLSQMQSSAANALQNPTVYDDPLYQQITSAEKQNVNQDYKGQLSDLTSELANRGINFSSIAGGKLNDLFTAKANALSNIDTTAAAGRANDLAAGRAQAQSGALGAAGLEQGVEQSNLTGLTNERSYEDQLNQQARDESLQETLLPYQMSTDQQNQFTQALNAALQYGTAPGATSLLGTAGGLFQGNSQLYGGMAQTSNQALSDSSSLQSLLQSLGVGGGAAGATDLTALLGLA